MLDVSLHSLSLDGRNIRDVTLTFQGSTHTAIVGPPGSGASTLLQLIAGRLRPSSGEIRIGARVVNDLKESRRPLLYVTSSLDVPSRWSVRHALIAAVRTRSLDRIDRQREYQLATEKWNLGSLIERRIGTLSGSEQTIVHVARIELVRPGILAADRLFERLNASSAEQIVDTFYRMLRVAGTTVISAPAMRIELGSTDRVVVLSSGRVAQEGTAAQIYTAALSEAAAAAMGGVNIIPLTIHGTLVESVIGAWDVSNPPFQGTGIALVRPEAFSVAPPGAESDLIIAVEEASFENGRWLVRAILGAGLSLRVSLPADTHPHKGKLLGLTYDSKAFSLVRQEMEARQRSVPTDAIPPMSESR